MAMYNNYQQPYFPNYQQNYQQAQQPMTIQNGGFISVRSEMEARNYPIAPGNSITFKDENAPYVYTKTMGFSQLDRPTFEKFKLVKEEAQIQEYGTFSENPMPNTNYVEKAEFDALRGEISALKEKVTVAEQFISGFSDKKANKKDEVKKDA